MLIKKQIRVLQNVPLATSQAEMEKPTIRITSEDPSWEDAYYNWFSGKNPTFSPEWKKGIYFHYEEIPTLAVIPITNEVSYWQEGNHIYDFWINKFDCPKCGKARIKAYCSSCTQEASKKDRAKMIDVLAPTAMDEIQAKREYTLTPEMFRSLADTYGYVNHFFAQLDKFFNFVRVHTKDHGNQLHKVEGCSECIKEQLEWLEVNHKDWRTKANEAGCCNLCAQRAYKTLSATPIVVLKETIKEVVKKPDFKKESKSPPRAVAL